MLMCRRDNCYVEVITFLPNVSESFYCFSLHLFWVKFKCPRTFIARHKLQEHTTSFAELHWFDLIELTLYSQTLVYHAKSDLHILLRLQ